jgi:hypothetical protein
MSTLRERALFHYPIRRLGLGLLLALALLFFLSLCRYQPPLVGALGFETKLVSDPGYFGSPIKRIQTFFEYQPCTYELFGWEDDTNFYYADTCYGHEKLWRYDWRQERSYAVEAIPAELYVQPSGGDGILTAVRASGVRPQEYESITRPLLLVDNSGLVSPDGRSIAFITQRIYSVYDVVIIKAMND